ncbi:MAG TPA: transposase [Rhizomicrobium sp.]|jgi:transposase-like protein|nr:transposase [Rhizomicrobium sp.]
MSFAASIIEYPSAGSSGVSPFGTRRLAPSYAVLAFDTLPLQMRGDTAPCFGIGIDQDGNKTLLGVWQLESDADWTIVWRDLHARGLDTAQLVIADAGRHLELPLAAAFPEAVWQPSLPSLIRQALARTDTRHRAGAQTVIRAILAAPNESAAWAQFEKLARGRFAEMGDFWQARLPLLTAYFKLAPPARRFFTSFDAAASLKAKLARRATPLPKNARDDAAALQSALPVLAEIGPGWKVAPRLWSGARVYLRDLARAGRGPRPASWPKVEGTSPFV